MRGLWNRARSRRPFRQVTHYPGFSALVILTLAGTIGMAVTVFSLFDAALLRPFPYPKPSELVRVRTFSSRNTPSLADASVYDFEDWQKANRTFAALAAYNTFHDDLTGAGEAQVIVATASTPELFRLLGARPALGRTFTAAEDRFRGDVHRVILSYGLWQRLFHGDAGALGRVVRLGGESYGVIGVMPFGFGYPDRTEAWIPLMAKYSANADPWWKLRDMRVNAVLGRLKPRVTPAQAQLDIDRIAAAPGKQFPATNAGIHAEVEELRQAETAGFRGYLLLIGASVLLLLAIGCINTAALFVARATARQREFAIRAALGSGLSHLVKQLFEDSLLYGILGCALGLAVAVGAIHILPELLPANLPGWITLRLDWRVLLFSASLACATVLLFGCAPLVGTARLDLMEALKRSGDRSSAGKSTAFGLRRALIVLEVAFSLALLVGAGLMLRSLSKLLRVETGIRTDRLIVATVTRYLPNASEAEKVNGYSKEFQMICRRLTTLRGVVGASAGDDIPYLDQPESRASAELFTRERAYRGPAASADVLPGYFDALGIRLLAGRDFRGTDRLDRAPVAIVSRHTADTLFPGRSAVGEQIRWGANDTYNPWSTVVGVVGDTKWNPAERQPDMEVYWSALQYPPSQTNLLIRTESAPQRLLPAVEKAIRDVSPTTAIMQTKTMDAVVRDTLWPHRLWGYVLAIFATFALALTAAGLYGVMSYLVSQSTREIGIRMALGSTQQSVLRLILFRGLWLVGIGLALGLAMAFTGSRLLASLLYGIGGADPRTYLIVVGTLGVVTFIACVIPGWRASRLNPLTALRAD